MNIPIILNFDEKQIVGVLKLDNKVEINWLKMGFSEKVMYKNDKIILISIGIIPRKTRINNELIIEGGKIKWRE